MIWLLMWLNVSVATLNAMLQLLVLNRCEATELFSEHAFRRNKPNDDYLELVNEVICYAKGLPLALVVMSVDLYGRTTLEWKSALDKYRKIPNGDIQKILKISYERLEETE